MGYILGIDLGTTHSAAAIATDAGASIVELGSEGAAIPSVVAVRDDGDLITGEAAVRRARTRPERAASEFKRRFGDPVPLVLGGTPYGVEALTARLAASIAGRVSELEGAPPDGIVLTHPATYGRYKLDLLAEVARLADLGEAPFLPEPRAAAVHYAALERVAPGDLVAVYDFGGGTFDAALLRCDPDGFTLLGEPQGLDRFGGIDIDHAVFEHVRSALPQVFDGLDTADPEVVAALADLKEECRRAKEALSADDSTAIPVAVGGTRREVALRRPRLEEMIRPRLDDTIGALERAISSAGVGVEAITRVLLVGGSSRIPLVAETVAAATGRPVTADAHPKHAVALGAARWGRRHFAPPGAGTPGTVPWAEIARAMEDIRRGEAPGR